MGLLCEHSLQEAPRMHPALCARKRSRSRPLSSVRLSNRGKLNPARRRFVAPLVGRSTRRWARAGAPHGGPPKGLTRICFFCQINVSFAIQAAKKTPL